jgi:hypothetical protein
MEALHCPVARTGVGTGTGCRENNLQAQGCGGKQRSNTKELNSGLREPLKRVEQLGDATGQL